MPALIAGTQAPEVRLPLLAGGVFDLSEHLRRGPVLLAFFKVGCPTCQYAAPFLERLHGAFPGRVVGVSQDGPERTAEFSERFGLTFPIALDPAPAYAVSTAYGLTNVPSLFLVDPDGGIALSSVGWSRADMQAIHETLAGTNHTGAPPLFQAGETVLDFKAG